MKVLVCGGRNYANVGFLNVTLSELHVRYQFTRLIHGGANGADTLAGAWAIARGIPVDVFPAEWRSDGRAAGAIRNVRMLREGQPQLIVAFPGGKGTAHMVSIAKRALFRVIEITEPK